MPDGAQSKNLLNDNDNDKDDDNVNDNGNDNHFINKKFLLKNPFRPLCPY